MGARRACNVSAGRNWSGQGGATGKPKRPAKVNKASSAALHGVLQGQLSISRPLHTKQTRPRGPWAGGRARRRRLARARERECVLASLLLGEAPTPPPPAPLARAAGTAHGPVVEEQEWLGNGRRRDAPAARAHTGTARKVACVPRAWLPLVSPPPHLLPPPDHCWVPRPAVQPPLAAVAARHARAQTCTASATAPAPRSTMPPLEVVADATGGAARCAEGGMAAPPSAKPPAASGAPQATSPLDLEPMWSELGRGVRQGTLRWRIVCVGGGWAGGAAAAAGG